MSAKHGEENRLDMIIKSDELQIILNVAGDRPNNLKEFLTFLLYTGMRPDEAASL